MIRLSWALLRPIMLAPLLASPNLAVSHTLWDPDGLIKPRTQDDAIKSGPCGAARTDNPVVLQSGATIEVAFLSTIFHQGEFRIAFSPANDEGFDENVLADNIVDVSGQRQRTHAITLPNIECDACTLQLIQTMLDRNPPSNYFSCADIRLTANGLSEPDADDTTAPAAVTGLLALPGDGSADLMWTNPSDADLQGVLLLVSESAITAQPEAGTAYAADGEVQGARVLFSGQAASFKAQNLQAGTTYHFAAFAYDSSLNYAPAAVTEVSLAEDVPNLAPAVALVMEQAGRVTEQNAEAATISTADGPVLVQANVTDMNAEDQHSIDWSGSDSRLTNSSEHNLQFQFDPSTLTPGDYRVMVQVTDDGMPMLSTSAELAFTVTEPATVRAPSGAGGFGGAMLAMILFSAATAWRSLRIG